MQRRLPSLPATDICWKCQWRIANQRHRWASTARVRPSSVPNSTLRPPVQRAFCTTRLRPRPVVSAASTGPEVLDPAILDPSVPVRERLKLWQQLYGGPGEEDLVAFENHPSRGEIYNTMSSVSLLGLKSDEGYSGEENGRPEDIDGEDMVTIALFLKQGDVVELSQDAREPVLAVFVQQIGLRSQFLSANGRWCHAILSQVQFAVPGCIDPALIKPLIPFLPTRPDEAHGKGSVQVPLQLAAPILQILGHIGQESERIYRENATVLDNAFTTLADQTRTRMMTLAHIAKTLLAPRALEWEPSVPALLAVRKALLHNSFRFVSDRRHQRLTNIFAIRPREDVAVIETVRDWIRQFQDQRASSLHGATTAGGNVSREADYISEFVEKARRLVTISRQHRDPFFGVVGPSKIRPPPNDDLSLIRSSWAGDFSSSDKQIIKFLQAWVLTDQFNKTSSLYSACTTILHATGCYEHATQIGPVLEGEESVRKARDKERGNLFLQELGVLSPHDDRHIYDENLMLPSVRLTRNVELLSAKAELIRKRPDFRDSMAEIRKDWGEMDVYCIDEAGAQEIDDGISISKAAGNASEYWVHVHVANPTAFFDKTHVLSGLAAHMAEAVYTPAVTFPMLPTWVTRDHFSLAPDRPVLTFSTRLDGSGAIQERRIQPGIVRRVTYLTPGELSECLGQSPQPPTRLVVGGEVPVAEAKQGHPVLSPNQRKDLKDLYEVAGALFARRRASGDHHYDIFESTCKVYEKPGRSGLTRTPPSTDSARLIHGDPIIALTARVPNRYVVKAITALDTVRFIMQLACETAAAWCEERGIPLVYRGTVEDTSATGTTAEEFEAKVMKPYMETHERLPKILAMEHDGKRGRPIAHSSPIPHKNMGVDSYAKVTSPLRRFSDMLAHWQIEAAVLYEARTGRKFDFDDNAAVPPPSLPFSRQQVHESIVSLLPKERVIMRVQNDSQQYWACLAFLRAFYCNETELPDTFRVWIRQYEPAGMATSQGANDVSALGFLVDYGVKVKVRKFEALPMQKNDEWEVKISEIRAFHGDIYVEPLRLLHRDEALSEYFSA